MQNANATQIFFWKILQKKKDVDFGHQILLEVNCPKGKRIPLAMGVE